MYSVRIRWNPSSHPMGIMNYEVEAVFGGMSQGMSPVYDTMREFLGVPGDTDVEVRVVAVSSTGRRSQPGTVTFRTPPDVPPPVDPDPTTPDGFTVEYF